MSHRTETHEHQHFSYRADTNNLSVSLSSDHTLKNTVAQKGQIKCKEQNLTTEVGEHGADINRRVLACLKEHFVVLKNKFKLRILSFTT